MAEFDEVRDELGRVRSERDAAKVAQSQARERLRRLAASESTLDRTFNPDLPEHQAERARLRAERAEAEHVLGAQRERLNAAKLRESEVFANFAAFTDPREVIERLDDGIPILLMPVRLETRFITTVNVAGANLAQLWVRVYPDDCWIDSFDPTLTETEVVDAKAYWIGIWKAGGFPEQERGAWSVLATSNGSGRANWIVSQSQPANLGEKPGKPRPQDILLTIATETAPADNENDLIRKFWLASWLGDSATLSEAQAALEGLVGPEQAAEILAKHQPVNFADPLPAGVTKDQLNVSIAFLVFAPIETKQSAWAHAPQLKTLPDRFVFLGYQGDRLTVVELGNPVPSPLIAGPDPSLPKEEQLQLDDAGNMVVPEEMKWITDFDRAVQLGMGFRINLDEVQTQSGFDRVLVVGLRVNAKAETAKEDLETLFRNHSLSRTGLGIVPQGTPTNNTEAVGSGFGRLDDPDESFDDLTGPLFTASSDWLDKRDGQWVAEYLGINPTLFENVHNAGSTDQSAARAMNIALWPATLGYWMESMMSGVFTRDGIEQTRAYFNRYVVGAGAIPAIRIGSQPYGILPATAISRMRWLDQSSPNDFTGLTLALPAPDPLRNYLRQLYPILLAIDGDWRNLLSNVSFVGKAGDPAELLLDIVGLHPGSVEWTQRYAESLKTVFNRLNLLGLGGLFPLLVGAVQRAQSQGLLQTLGAPKGVRPLILDQIFAGSHYELKGGVVDDKPLSEILQIREYTDNHRNYIQWLIDSANTSLDALYTQDGFTNDRPPTAILYLLLRHALQLGYDDVSIRLRENAGLFTAAAAMSARVDPPFLHIDEKAEVSESRYQRLYEAVPAITGNATQPFHQFIASQIPTLSFTFHLREQLAALERLKIEPTGRLERAFADHVDCCAYRLDAWLLGIVNYQLSLMRNIRDRQDSAVKPGIHLGGYAWLEDLRPENKVLTEVILADPGLITDFASAGEPPLRRDSTNQGFIHGPSLNHSTAASVLRNGFISNASPANRQTMAINLTSERVRTALALLEGIRAGQGLADLLGYQFERGLHDRHSLAEVDKFILKLRRAFPLRADRMNSTKPPEGVSIEAIEARNVIDGLALVEHIKATGIKTYPFGKTGLLETESPAEDEALNAEADRLLESHDAIADLALSEGVYQAVMGNYDRVASTYDAYARGNFPPEPEITHTPTNGIGITHRVALHLEAGADPNISPNGLDPTPRAQAEPALNNWLAAILPPLDQVGCVVSYRVAGSLVDTTNEVRLSELGIQPADLVALLQDGNEQAMSELEDRVVRRAVETFSPPPRPDSTVSLRYLEKDTAPISFFELMPLVRNVRQLITKSRPLQATDLKLTNEAESSQDSQPFVDIQRLTLVQAAMIDLREELAAFQAQLEGPLSDLDTRKGEILADVDQYVAQVVGLLARAATFVVAQAGWGFAYDFRRRVFAAILKQFDDLVKRWDEKLVEFNALLTEESVLPITAIAEKLSLLTQAERAISTVAISPPPTDPVSFRNDLIALKLPPFTAKRGDLANIQATTLAEVSQLLAHAKTLLPLSDFDFLDFSLVADEDEMVRFTEDAVGVVNVVIAELDRRLAISQGLFDEHSAATDRATRVRVLEEAAKSLLGADFRIFPEFSLTVAQGDEIENALAASTSGELFDHLKNPVDPNLAAEDFPEDTWLYGLARVREKMHAWEQTVMFAGSLGQPEPELQALQLPFIPGDRWLGLEFPPEQTLDQERLLYTAHFAATFAKASPQCGMLLDEWVETIPGSEVDTGIAFHYDRPNCEAPQTMLLVTPSIFRGAWQWEDLVDALNETLDFAKRRAVEPRLIDATPYAPLLPATIMASQVAQLTMAANLALNNRVGVVVQD